MSAPIGRVFASADVFVNSLLAKRVAIATQAAPAVIDSVIRTGDRALGGTSSAPVGIVSARAGIDPARAEMHRARAVIERVPAGIDCAPLRISRAAVHPSRARASNAAAHVVARSMRSGLSSGCRSGDAGSVITRAAERRPTTARPKGEGRVV